MRTHYKELPGFGAMWGRYARERAWPRSPDTSASDLASGMVRFS